tara:strand:- start:472 stop:1266 length:795 start_codon:yes stop_codon:yes gene_type:complete
MIGLGVVSIGAVAVCASALPEAHAVREPFAFAFVQTSPDYACMTKVAIRSLQLTGAKEPIVLLSTFAVDDPMLGVRVERIDSPPTKGQGRYRDTFAKLLIARLPYDRVVLFDSDVLIHRSPSFLFQVDPKDGIAGVESYWTEDKSVGSATPLIVNPNRDLFRDVLEHDDLTEKYPGDMEYIVERFSDTAVRLPYHVSVLASEYVPDHELFGVRGGAPRMYMMIHFDGLLKPTLWTMQRLRQLYSDAPHLLEEFSTWYALRDAVC